MKNTVRLSVIDLMLFYLSVAHVERIIKTFINHESVPWWQWLFLVVAIWVVKTVVDVVEKKP